MSDQRFTHIQNTWDSIKNTTTYAASTALVVGITFDDVVKITAWLWIMLQLITFIRDRWYQPWMRRQRVEKEKRERNTTEKAFEDTIDKIHAELKERMEKKDVGGPK